jgi:glycosyl transferase, family 25
MSSASDHNGTTMILETQRAPMSPGAFNGLNRNVEIVVISVPTAAKRRSSVNSMFEGAGLNWRYFDAHTSLQHAGLTYDLREIKRRFGRTLSLPEIAVSSSHVAVLSEFLQRGTSDYVLVLEDDVIFDTDFPLDKFGALCADNGIDYIRLFGKHYAKAVRIGFFFDRSIIRYETSPAGAQAYMMSKNGARLFMENFRSIDATVDLAMDKFWKLGMPIYSIFPYPIIERYSPTSIPMPRRTAELDEVDRAVWNYNRVIAKAEKVRANILLGAKDRHMRREFAPFQQIFDEA